MKIVALYDLTTGRVIQYTSVQLPDTQVVDEGPVPTDELRYARAAQAITDASGWGHLFCDPPKSRSYVDLATLSLVALPEQPSDVAVWDDQARQWIDDLDLCVAAATRRIETERVERSTAPIDYDRKRLDADRTAQDNIKAKLARLGESERLDKPVASELLVWRDADNITHTWDNQVAYRDWLGGLAAAIDDRATEAYAWAWDQKGRRDQAIAAKDIATLLKIPLMLIPAGETMQ